MITVDLLRHGEPAGGNKYRGQLDDPLTELGWQQMRDAIGTFRNWDRIISSPLVRCSAFAQQIAEQMNISLSHETNLMEIGFGLWEGKTIDQIQQTYAEELTLFWRNPIQHTPPQAENVSTFNSRVIHAFNKIVTQNPNRHLLFVVHAGVIRILLRHILDFPLQHLFRIQVPYASISRILVDPEQNPPMFSLEFHAGQLP